MEQYLLEGDGYFTIIEKSSIAVDENEIVELKVGSTINYLWPERARHKKKYSGKIVGISTNEADLLKLKTQKLQEATRSLKRKRNEKSTTSCKKNQALSDDNPQKKINQKLLRKEANISSAKEILKTLDMDTLECSTLSYALNNINIALRLAKDITPTLEKAKKSLEDFLSDQSSELIHLDTGETSTFVIHGQPSSSNQIQYDPSTENLPRPVFEGQTSSSNRKQDDPSTEKMPRPVNEGQSSSSNQKQDDPTTENQLRPFIEGQLSSLTEYHSTIEEPPSNSLRPTLDNHSEDNILETEDDIDPNAVNNTDLNIFLFTKQTANDQAVELYPESDLYIDKTAFNDAKKKSTSQAILCRFLLISTIKEEVLLSKSLSKEEKDQKQDAVNKILKYSRSFAKRVNWKPVDDQIIKSSIRSKIREMRNKMN
ncbi:uncharacterized protein LOC122509929 [Leptopilina heterotoma]|nr:uncharacterized protein LOC122507641 [Leptopilina heterotoma]XP_043480194.1 uncharacterized protein LOC122509929 [Leptopilina heterotoma]